jgi:hypothetical protein
VKFHQRLFGLDVRSSAPLPFAESASFDVPDVELTFESLPPSFSTLTFTSWLPSGDAEFQTVSRSGELWKLDYRDGTCVVVERDAIWMTWEPELTFEDACTYLYGAPFALLLRMRGKACLHASAATIAGRTVALVGPSGSGKSTLIGSMVRGGAVLVADDLLALAIVDGSVVATPAYPGVRLWPAGAELIAGDANAFPRITASWEKRILLADKVAATPQSIDEIHLLGEGDDVALSDALMRLVANSYRPDLCEPEWRRNEFEILSALVQQATIRPLDARSGSPRSIVSELTRAHV